MTSHECKNKAFFIINFCLFVDFWEEILKFRQMIADGDVKQ